jgi:methyl-accepting chemotaxis protein
VELYQLIPFSQRRILRSYPGNEKEHVMKLKSLRSKLVISISTLVIGSGLIISMLETNRFSNSLHESTISQGEYLFINRITRPLSALAEAAENIDEKNLEFNLEPAGRDEVGRLTSSLNKIKNEIYAKLLPFSIIFKQLAWPDLRVL